MILLDHQPTVDEVLLKASEQQGHPFRGNQWTDAAGSPIPEHSGFVDEPDRPDKVQMPDLLETKPKLKSGQWIVEVHHVRDNRTDAEALSGIPPKYSFHGPSALVGGSSVHKALTDYGKSEQYQRDRQHSRSYQTVYKIGGVHYKDYGKGVLIRLNPKAEWLKSARAELDSLLTAIDAEVDRRVKAAEPDTYDFHDRARRAAEAVYDDAVRRWLSAAEADVIRKKKKTDDLLALWLMFIADAEEQGYQRTSTLLGGSTEPKEAQEFAQSRQQFLRDFPTRAIERLTKVDGDWHKVREEGAAIEAGDGRRLVETEGQITYGSAQLRLLQRAGFATAVWHTMEDSHVRPTHQDLNGQEVKLGDKFANGLRFPGDPQGPLSEIIGCRCWLVGGRRSLAQFGTVKSTEQGHPFYGNQWTEGDGVGMKIRILHRASNKPGTFPGAHFAERESDAEAYTANQGFGGHSVHKYSVRMANPLELTQRHARDLRHLAQVYANLKERDAGEIEQEWHDSGYDSVFSVLENARGVNDEIAAKHDWVRFLDDFPENSTTWKQLHPGSYKAVASRKVSKKM